MLVVVMAVGCDATTTNEDEWDSIELVEVDMTCHLAPPALPCLLLVIVIYSWECDDDV